MEHRKVIPRALLARARALPASQAGPSRDDRESHRVPVVWTETGQTREDWHPCRHTESRTSRAKRKPRKSLRCQRAADDDTPIPVLRPPLTSHLPVEVTPLRRQAESKGSRNESARTLQCLPRFLVSRDPCEPVAKHRPSTPVSRISPRVDPRGLQLTRQSIGPRPEESMPDSAADDRPCRQASRPVTNPVLVI